MKILSHSIFISFLAASSWLSATIAPDDPEWPETYPEWWYNADNPANGVIDVTEPVLNQGNDAPLNIGQLKNIATEARDELDSVLAPVGGAGTEIDTLVDSFITITPSNLSPTNIGQLKNVSSKFFDRLAEVGFAPGSEGWSSSLILDEGDADNSLLYPWLNDVTAENAAPASIGQAKHLFSWDLRSYVSYNSDSDNLPDWWELYWFGDLNSNSHDDNDSDGWINSLEFELGTDPTVFSHSYPISNESSTGPFGDLDDDHLANEMENVVGLNKDTLENADLIKSTSNAGPVSSAFITVIGKGTFKLSEQDEALNLE